jgi:predicted nuclease of restriction endonuclease-like RecB superfamily
VGFWTRRALERKLALVRAAGLSSLLCVDLTRNCGRADVPEDARVLPFTGRIDPNVVVTALEAALS